MDALNAFVHKVAQATLPTEEGLGFSLDKEIQLPTGITGTRTGSGQIPYEIIQYTIAFADAYKNNREDLEQKAEDLHGALLVALTMRMIPDTKVYDLINEMNTLMEAK